MVRTKRAKKLIVYEEYNTIELPIYNVCGQR